MENHVVLTRCFMHVKACRIIGKKGVKFGV